MMDKQLLKKTDTLRFRTIIRASKLASAIPNQVKIAILKTTGDQNPDPATVKDDTPMAGYAFDFPAYSRLTRRFTTIARVTNPKADIAVRDVQDCVKVSDCIDLVTKNS